MAHNNAARAPKQWSLTKDETITSYSFESWRQNLKYCLSLDPNFATFIQDGADAEWLKKSRAEPNRGLDDDDEDVLEARRRTAQQKVIHLELMLGQIANYCPIISRNTIVRNSTSLENVWQAIRAHFGFQTTGAHFIDFADIKLKPGERPEDLYQRIVAFVEDNLLTMESGITHHGEDPEDDEELTPMIENMIVLTWLRLVHADLPGLVKQRYGTELRSATLASIKPEISQAMGSLLETLNSTEEARVMRSAAAPFTNYQHQRNNRPRNNFNRQSQNNNNNNNRNSQSSNKQCPLCSASGRSSSHYLSQCSFLPAADKKFIAKARLLSILDGEPEDYEQDDIVEDHDADAHSCQVTVSRRVQICKSPTLTMQYMQFSVPVMLDSGGETNMIKEAVLWRMGGSLLPTKQSALQADGITLKVKGETSFEMRFDEKRFKFTGLVVEDLDVDILAGQPFMMDNDIALRPARSLIIFSDGSTYQYQTSKSSVNSNVVRRVSSHIIRAPPSNTTIFPGDHIDVDVPHDLSDQTELALEPRLNNSVPDIWPTPAMVTPICGKVRVVNETCDPIVLRKNEQFGQLHGTCPQDESVSIRSVKPTEFSEAGPDPAKVNRKPPSSINDIKVDPNSILKPDMVAQFHATNRRYKNVFNTKGKLYNGAFGPVEAVVNMGPSLPPQRKGRIPQYSRDKHKLVELQEKF